MTTKAGKKADVKTAGKKRIPAVSADDIKSFVALLRRAAIGTASSQADTRSSPSPTAKASKAAVAKARKSAKALSSGITNGPNRVIAYSELAYVELKTAAQQKRLNDVAPGFASWLQHEYVLVKDFTVLFRINGRLHSTTVPKGYIANGVTAAPFFDDKDPKSWWVHDWHYGKHHTTPSCSFFQNGTPLSVAPATELTREEFDSIFEPASLRAALAVVGVVFGDLIYGITGARTTWVVPALATRHMPAQITTHPANGLTPTAPGQFTSYAVSP